MTDAAGHEIMAFEVSRERPPEDVPVEVLRSGLRSEDSIVRAHAAAVASNLPEAEFDTLAAVVPALVEGLDDDRLVVAFHAATALSLVAEDRPGRLEPAVPGLVSLLGSDLSLIRASAARALGLVAIEHPGFLVGHVETLLSGAAREPEDVLDPEMIERADFDYDRADKYHAVNREERLQQARARTIAANLVVEVADHDPSAVAPHVPSLVALLDDEDDAVVTAAAAALGRVARGEPDAVAEADAVDALQDLLDRPDDGVVANAVVALGFVGDPAAVEPLRDLAGEGADRDGDLRDLARETADFLAGGE